MKFSPGLLLPALMFISCGKIDQAEKIKAQDPFKTNGHETGNGSDNLPWDHGTAWLAGPDTEISYCYEISKFFGTSPEKAEADLGKAFLRWKQYIETKSINEAIEKEWLYFLNLPGGRWRQGAPEGLQAKSKLFRLPVKSRLKEKCDGSETVKFFFGVENELIRTLKKGYNNPTAFASRLEYNEKTGIGKGVVWINQQGGLGESKGNYPDWTLPNRLLGILTHEIGHVYGIGHVEDTIMQQDFWGFIIGPEWTTRDQKIVEYQLSHIDHAKELYMPKFKENKQTYTGRLSYVDYEERDKLEAAENFKFITGKDASGEIKSLLADGKLILSDEEQSFDIKLKYQGSHQWSAPQNIFRTYRQWDHTEEYADVGGGGQLQHIGNISFGTIERMNGERLQIMIDQNMGLTPMRLTYLRDGEERALLILDPTF